MVRGSSDAGRRWELLEGDGIVKMITLQVEMGDGKCNLHTDQLVHRRLSSHPAPPPTNLLPQSCIETPQIGLQLGSKPRVNWNKSVPLYYDPAVFESPPRPTIIV